MEQFEIAKDIFTRAIENGELRPATRTQSLRIHGHMATTLPPATQQRLEEIRPYIQADLLVQGIEEFQSINPGDRARHLTTTANNAFGKIIFTPADFQYYHNEISSYEIYQTAKTEVIHTDDTTQIRTKRIIKPAQQAIVFVPEKNRTPLDAVLYFCPNIIWNDKGPTLEKNGNNLVDIMLQHELGHLALKQLVGYTFSAKEEEKQADRFAMKNASPESRRLFTNLRAATAFNLSVDPQNFIYWNILSLQRNEIADRDEIASVLEFRATTAGISIRKGTSPTEIIEHAIDPDTSFHRAISAQDNLPHRMSYFLGAPKRESFVFPHTAEIARQTREAITTIYPATLRKMIASMPY